MTNDKAGTQGPLGMLGGFSGELLDLSIPENSLGGEIPDGMSTLLPRSDLYCGS